MSVVLADTAEGLAKQYWDQTSEMIHDDLGRALHDLDERIASHEDKPFHLAVKCRLINHFAYLEDFYWDDLDDRLKDCEERLYASDQEHPEVWLYRIENSVTDEAIEFGDQLLRSGLQAWSDEQIAALYRQLTYEHQWADAGTPGAIAISALSYGVDDPQVVIAAAREYASEGDGYLALSTLERLPDDVGCWVLSQVAELVALELDDSEAARGFLDRAKNDGCADASFNWEALAAIHESLGEYDEADRAMQEAVDNRWNSEELLRRWFEKALSDGAPDRALAAYERMRDQGYFADPLAYHRIRLFLAHPELGWNGRDMAGLAVLMLAIACIVLLPLMLLIPVHWRGLLRQRSGLPRQFLYSQWNLRHAWLLLAAFLLIDTGLSFAFFYDDLIGAVSEEAAVEFAIGEESITNFQLVFLVLMGLLTLAVIPKGLKTLTPGNWSLGKCIGTGIGFAVLLKLVAALNISLFQDVFEFAAAPFTEWMVLDTYQRFGAVAVVLTIGLAVPVIEEVMFRGVLLASFAKHISFGWANTIQASLFAVIHEDLGLFLFYLAFGLVAGELFRRSGSLLPAITVHVCNNLVAIALLIAIA